MAYCAPRGTGAMDSTMPRSRPYSSIFIVVEVDKDRLPELDFAGVGDRHGHFAKRRLASGGDDGQDFFTAFNELMVAPIFKQADLAADRRAQDIAAFPNGKAAAQHFVGLAEGEQQLMALLLVA